jgi:hypothetical protein
MLKVKGMDSGQAKSIGTMWSGSKYSATGFSRVMLRDNVKYNTCIQWHVFFMISDNKS